MAEEERVGRTDASVHHSQRYTFTAPHSSIAHPSPRPLVGQPLPERISVFRFIPARSLTMSGITSVNVLPLAHKKLVLHTAKYPTARVLGLLLADAATISSQGLLTVTDVIPLSHHWTALAPMAEVALSLATSYASSNKLAIVGVYEAPELVSNRTPSQPASKLAEKIATLAKKDALLLLINNATLLSPNDHSLSAYTVAPHPSGAAKGDAKAKALQGSAVSLQDPAKARELEGAVRKESAWEKLVDFDGELVFARQYNGDVASWMLTVSTLLPWLCYRSPRRSITGLAAEFRHCCMNPLCRLPSSVLFDDRRPHLSLCIPRFLQHETTYTDKGSVL